MAKNEKPALKERLKHISEAIDRIIRFTADMKYEQFIDDDRTQLAVIKLFEIIGEASYQITNDYKKVNPHIEWKNMEGLRHVLVHDYYKIDSETLWNTKEIFLTELKIKIDKLIDETKNE